MKTLLSYKVTTLKEGLKKTYEWYVKNEWWWKPLINDKFFKEDEPWKNNYLYKNKNLFNIKTKLIKIL